MSSGEAGEGRIERSSRLAQRLFVAKTQVPRRGNLRVRSYKYKLLNIALVPILRHINVDSE